MSWEKIMRRVHSLVSAAKVGTTTESGNVQTLQAAISPLETIDNLASLGHWGLASRPHPGADAVVLFLSGDRSKGFCLGTADQRYHFQVAEGEVALHDDQGCVIHLTRNGIVIDGGGTNPITIQNTPKVRMVTPLLQVTGDIVDHCDDGTGQTMLASRQAYDAHVHPGVQTGQGSTQPPSAKEPE